MQQNPQTLLVSSEVLFEAAEVDEAIARMATEITNKLSDKNPLLMAVMGGAVVFAGKLLPQLNFPLTFDFVQASRYHDQTQGQELVWGVEPKANIRHRVVLLLDDILDQGHTLSAVKEKCLELGAQQVLIAVLAEKVLSVTKPVKADFIGLQVPDRYVFGCGMDAYGYWRNLPSIHALK